ncbi:MAG: sarcosine oxidase subunit alpha family protein [Burkholderiaceae bacterium]
MKKATNTRIIRPHTRIDATQTINFTFDGRRYTGHPGDTLASALLSNGFRLLARSFKYGRPRGIVGAGPEEPNALVQLELGEYTIPNVKATQIELYEGLRASRTTGSPSLRFDFKALLGRAGRFMPAGFYSKTFKWPAKFWPSYERLIRGFSGYGTAPRHPDTETYDHLHHHVDVVVVGAGLAGLVAARRAGAAGLKTLLVDEQAEAGGWLLSDPTQMLNDEAAERWRSQVLSELEILPTVQVLTRTTAYGLYDNNLVLALEQIQDHIAPARRQTHLPRQRQHKIRARQIILATGAIERPLVFGNNDRPGVMTMAAGLTYLNRYGVLVGKHVLIVGVDDDIYPAAAEFASKGAKVVLVDVRTRQPRFRLPTGVTAYRGYTLAQVLGSTAVKGAILRPLIDNENDQPTVAAGKPVRIKTDAVLSSAGLVPTVHLYCHDGGRPEWRDDLQAYVAPEVGREGVACVGAVTGCFGPSKLIMQTAVVVDQIIKLLGGVRGKSLPPLPRTPEAIQIKRGRLVRLPDGQPEGLAAKAFVDFQNDVTAADIELAVRENYQSIEHVKRYTALGFGTDQGKLSNVNGFILAARALNKPVEEVGTTTYRPAYTPVTFGALAGPIANNTYDPERLTALHSWHVAQGCVFECVGQWLRPHYYPRAGESMLQAVNRECLAVRNHVGIMDVSTLGKIQIDGPDSREFIERIYCTSFAKLKPGGCQYGLMLDENGMVMDDGVVACISDHQFILTTTTGGAARVFAWLEQWHQTEWPELKIWISSVTDQLAAIALAGPQSRTVLQSLVTDIDLSHSAFPFMSWREGQLAGIPVRVWRVSFSGELAYEIHFDSSFALSLWKTLIEAGEPHGVTPYGTETMHVLRAEKGLIIVGQDTDGSVTPVDLGMNWAVGKSKSFPFIGQRSLTRSDTVRADRPQLVGLLSNDRSVVIAEGAQITAADPSMASSTRPIRMLGHVTSSYFSAALGHGISLALIENGRNLIGSTLVANARGEQTQVEVVKPVFLDPQGERQRA